MTEREIEADEVVKALHAPDVITPAKLGRKCVFKKRGNYWLRVILEEDERRVLVITTYVTRRR